MQRHHRQFIWLTDQQTKRPWSSCVPDASNRVNGHICSGGGVAVVFSTAGGRLIIAVYKFPSTSSTHSLHLYYTILSIRLFYALRSVKFSFNSRFARSFIRSSSLVVVYYTPPTLPFYYTLSSANCANYGDVLSKVHHRQQRNIPELNQGVPIQLLSPSHSHNHYCRH